MWNCPPLRLSRRAAQVQLQTNEPRKIFTGHPMQTCPDESNEIQSPFLTPTKMTKTTKKATKRMLQKPTRKTLTYKQRLWQLCSIYAGNLKMRFLSQKTFIPWLKWKSMSQKHLLQQAIVPRLCSKPRPHPHHQVFDYLQCHHFKGSEEAMQSKWCSITQPKCWPSKTCFALVMSA